MRANDALGASLATPAISKVFGDGTLVELIYDPSTSATAFAVAASDGSVLKMDEVTTPGGERFAPYSPKNNLIASACVLLPSDIGDFGDKGDLGEEICAFLHRYVDLSPLFEEIAAYYVLLTWVYDAFTDLPYLRFRGDYGTGKTRALLAVGSLCYKPFFASGASTVSPIFHIQDAFQGTLVLDEADFRFSDQTAELTKILNNGTTRGLPVLRTMANRHRELNPTAFNVFGPKIIAMRESFADRALESRFITEETGGRPLRSDVPIHLPEVFAGEALGLRNKLLAWRLSARRTVRADPARLIDGVEPRINQTALSLLSLIDEPALRAQIASHLSNEAARITDERAASPEATVLLALKEAMASSPAGVSIGAITEAFNRRALADGESAMTNKWVGAFLRRRLHLTTAKSRGVYVVPPTERPRIAALLRRWGVEFSAEESVARCDTLRGLGEVERTGNNEGN